MVRAGPALLTGLVVCGKCGYRMTVRYREAARHIYLCDRLAAHYGGALCQQLAGACLDRLVTQQVLAALAPAALELSLEAAAHVQRERAELDQLWRQRLERAAYQTDRARRQYDLVEPENRLVARQLERAWEDKLAAQQQLEAAYRRSANQQPRVLTGPERAAIRRLAADVPALWNAPTTTNADRKAIIRHVVERVTVTVHGDSERIGVTVNWASGACTQAELVRPVARLEQLSYYPQLVQRVRTLAGRGLSVGTIADRLNAEGYRPPKRRERLGEHGVQQLPGGWEGRGSAGPGRVLRRPSHPTGLASTNGGYQTWPGRLGCRRSRCSPGSNAAGSRPASNPSRPDDGSSGPMRRRSNGSASVASDQRGTTHGAVGSTNTQSRHDQRPAQADKGALGDSVPARRKASLCCASTR